ncbi:MAG: tRNA pseudouridine(55) synthase TruB [Oscillospiraceae bacterium]
MNGILLLDKPEGWTSHDAVAKLRGLTRERRIGHSGTLDPMATGLLVVFVGRATRAVEFAEADRKEYHASLRLGLTTDTLDITGTVLRETETSITRAQLEAVLPRFAGKQEQIPPMYSAIKQNGRKLCDIARSGGEVERPARHIEIYSIACTGEEDGDFKLSVLCSKGTYIRSLCADIGEALGCGGCMSALRRVSAGAFSLDSAHTLEEIAEQGAERYLLPVDGLFKAYPAITIGEAAEKSARVGADFSLDAEDGDYRVYGSNGEFLLLGREVGGRMHTIKSFFEV